MILKVDAGIWLKQMYKLLQAAWVLEKCFCLFMDMYTGTYVYMYVYAYMLHVRTFMYHIRISVHTCICVHHMNVCLCTHMCMCTCMYLYTCHVYVYMYVYACVDGYEYIRMYVYICMLALAAFKLKDSSDPPASASSVVGVISVDVVIGLSCPHFSLILNLEHL